MKKIYLCLLPIFVLASEPYHLKIQPTDLVPRQLSQSAIAVRAQKTNEGPVSFNHALSPEEGIDFKNQGLRTVSKSYRFVVQPKDIFEGISLDLSAPGAIVHIQPLVDEGEELSLDNRYAIQPESVIIVDQNQQIREGHKALRSFNSNQKRDLPEKFSIFQVAPDVPPGRLTLHLDQYQPTHPLQITVLEKNSPFGLELSADKGVFLEGQSISVNFNLLSASLAQANALTTRARAWLVSPSGSRIPMDPHQNRFSGKIPDDLASEPGLWEIQALASFQVGKLNMMRSGTLAFAYVLPTARFTGNIIRTRESFPGMDFSVEVEASLPGRYEVSGMVYGTSPQGKLLPLALFQSADFLNQTDMIDVHLDASYFENSELEPPYAIRGLTLKDQSRMQILSHVADGLAFRK